MKKILVRELEIGKYKSKTWWYKTDDGVWVDNSFHTIVKDINDNVVREIDNRRSVPKKSMPPICTHHPSDSITTAPILIDIDNNFWRFKIPIDRAITVWLSFDHQNGEWKIIDAVTGKVIGDSIPCPVLSKNDEGFSWTGPHDAGGPDVWANVRENADMWFKQWSIHATTTIGLATVAEITSNISDASNNLYYAYAHGDSDNATAWDTYLYASDVTTAMESRDPMWFAFIGHCHAMNDTGTGTFSYAFRKGSTTNTWTVGFVNMETCPSGSDAPAWQNEMFAHIHSGKTFKDAFDLATATYSGLDGYVAYAGDPTIGIITRKIQIKRGLDANHTSFTPADGEPIWCTDTKKLFVGDGVTAGGVEITGAGGSGETNTASNTGTVGTGVFKQKTGVDLELYKLYSANNLLTVGLNGTDRIDFTINEANINADKVDGKDASDLVLCNGNNAWNGTQVPSVTESINIGSATYKINEIHCKDSYVGDIVFEEKKCAKSGKDFKVGDTIQLVVTKTSEGGTHAVPVLVEDDT